MCELKCYPNLRVFDFQQSPRLNPVRAQVGEVAAGRPFACKPLDQLSTFNNGDRLEAFAAAALWRNKLSYVISVNLRSQNTSAVFMGGVCAGGLERRAGYER